MFEVLRVSASSWHESKLFIEHLFAISHDTLHLLAGLALWLALVAFIRRPINAWLPLIGTAAIATLNEAVDLWVELWPSMGHQLGEGARDILVTISIPTLLFAAARLRPSMFALNRRG